MNSPAYILQGGSPGVARLKVLSRVMRPYTEGLLLTAGLTSGMRCIDVGCGGGDVSMLLARMVGTTGRVLGLDIDKIALQVAAQESRDAGLAQVEFRESDACAIDAGNDNDIVYSRFLLSHVPQPLKAIDSMRAALGASGTIIIEDIDFHGHFCFPHNATFDEYVKLFQMTARARGADPEIGPKLPGMLATAGFKDISVRVAQPAAIAGETKAINALTLDAIGQSAITCGFATEVQIDRLSRELWRLAHDLETLMSIARVIQITARKC